MFKYIQIYVCLYPHTHIYIPTPIYVYIYICIHTNIYTCTFQHSLNLFCTLTNLTEVTSLSHKQHAQTDARSSPSTEPDPSELTD